MSTQSNPVTETPVVEAAKDTSAEKNFAQIRKALEKERSEKEALAKEKEDLQRLLQKASAKEEDDDDDEPYVDRRRLRKESERLKSELKTDARSEIQRAIGDALAEERKQAWIKNNPDYQEVLKHAQKVVEKYPDLAEDFLELPDGFERQKVVYRTIKALKLHEKDPEKPSVQETIDKNRRSPYYQPSGVANAPYAAAADYSEVGMKGAYAKMQELKKRMRI